MSHAPKPAIIDLRSAEEYARERPQGAVRLTLEDLLERAYLLPPRARELLLVGGSSADVMSVLDVLRQAERTVRHLPGASWRDELAGESGEPSRWRVWEEARIVSHAVETYSDSLPGRRALDVACGSGRNAVYLALQGFDVTGVDRLPDALERAQDLALRSRVRIRTLALDLEEPGALASARTDLVVVVRYLERALFPTLQALVSAGGLLVYETFTKAQAVLGHPRNPRFMLEEGELRNAFPALETLEYDEGFFDGAHLARYIGRRPDSMGLER